MTLKEMAKEFNRQYFYGVVDVDKIYFSFNNRFQSTRGMYRKRTAGNRIEIAEYLNKDSTGEEVRKTLIHELIHALQDQTGQKLAHDSFFYTIADRIYNLSNGKYHIKRCTRAESAEVQAVRKERQERLNKDLYFVQRDYKFNLIKNLKPNEIYYLKREGRRVYKVLKTDKVYTVCKNLEYLMKASYYYLNCLDTAEVEEL